MRAEITIRHKKGELIPVLSQIFGANTAAALKASALAKKSPKTAKSIQYAAYAPGLIVMAWDTPEEIVLYVESDGGRLRKAASQVWTATRRGCKHHHLRLDSLVLLDEDKGDQIATASVGLAANAKRVELLATAATGTVTAVVLALAGSNTVQGLSLTSDVVVGAIPALVATLIALVALGSGVRKRTLIWH